MPKKKITSDKQKEAVDKATGTEKEVSRSQKFKLLTGFLVLLIGCFLTLSVISYCLSWKEDQNNLLSNQSLMHFLFKDSTPVQNWCGRLGAGLAHCMIFKGVGITAILFSLWLIGIGINIIYGRRVLPTMKWVRWMALGFLFICPLLSFLFPDATFPLGGALGNSLIDWTDGFAGKAGNIVMLLAVAFFFAYIVFQWDIRPALLQARKLLPLKQKGAPDNDMATKNEQISQEDIRSTLSVHDTVALPEDETPHIVVASNNKLRDGKVQLNLQDDEADNMPQLELIQKDDATITSQKPQQATLPAAIEKEGITLELPAEENEIPADENIENDSEMAAAPDNTVPEMDFEVKTITEPEKTIPQHGAHISIQDNEPYDPALDLPDYKFPTLDLLDDRNQGEISLDREELEKNKNQIIATLRSFGIEIQRISATVGPTVTLYEIVPAEGVRISKIRNLEDDIALNLAALGIRIIAPIPGRGTIGIEVPNTNKQIVSMRSLLSSDKFINNKMSLPIALGKKIDNDNYIVDLATMPHLLMAGATGQGKSVGINAILVSLLYKKHPSQLKFVMVDPKKVELSVYRLIEKHYLAMLPNEEEAIITDTKKVINTVNALCIEMDNRYELLKDGGARNIKEYNEKFIKRKLNPQNGHKFLPFIVLVIDEFADLIMTAGKEVEMPIARLAQLARAVGIHIIIATQRPSVNVITGIIKANFPARIAFKVSAKVDSRTILDAGGAEQLIGRGDMLVSHGSELLRLQCAFVDTPEVERVVDFIGLQRGYPSAFELPEYEGAEDEREARESVDLTKRDKMFEECARLVVSSQSGSTSMLQRKFNLGYNRAGRIMDQLEAAGIVGPASGSKPRDVLISTEYELEQHLESLFL